MLQYIREYVEKEKIKNGYLSDMDIEEREVD